MPRMTVADARAYWMSSRIPSDQFLLYAFEGEPGGDVRNLLLERAAAIADLTVRMCEVNGDYPWWVPMTVTADRVVETPDPPATWSDAITAVERLLATSVDPREAPWTVHLLGTVRNGPGAFDGPVSIAVLQISHALADGVGTARIARALFGSEPLIPAIHATERPKRRPRVFVVPAVVTTFVRGLAAARAARTLESDTAAGRVPPAASGMPLTELNRRPTGSHRVRMIVLDSGVVRAPGISVTAGVMTVISVALQHYLGIESGLAAETTFAKPGPRSARNHFRNAGVDLHVGVDDLRERASAIAASLRDRRARFDHPSFDASDRATAAVPAPWIRSGIDRFDLTTVPETVTGATVVSSVNRGPADLVLGSAPVLFTAGFPGLSPVMGVTHGVHGIGDTVTISIHAASDVMPDVDRYDDMVRAAVRDVSAAFGPNSDASLS